MILKLRAAVEEALWILLRIRGQVQALKELEGSGWEGDLDEMRLGWQPHDL